MGKDVVPLLPSDTELELRLFLDSNTAGNKSFGVAEAYFMGGRVAMTVPLDMSALSGSSAWKATVAATSGSVTVLNGTSWSLSSIWVTPEDVLATPRPMASEILV